MRFIVPSKTFATLLGTSHLMALTPSYVSARIVGPSDIRAQVMVDLGYCITDAEMCYFGCPREITDDEMWQCINEVDCYGTEDEIEECTKNAAVNCTRDNISPECAEKCDGYSSKCPVSFEYCKKVCDASEEDCSSTCECNICFNPEVSGEEFNDCVDDHEYLCSPNSAEAVQEFDE
eukprot:scaffold40292_cov73-Cyclotella_meneghiniana.AAC.1